MPDTLATIAYGWADIAFTKDTWVREQSGSVFFGPPGSTEMNSGIAMHRPIFVLANTSMAFRGPGIINMSDYVQTGYIPSPFLATGWSVADSATATSADVTFTTLPAANGVTLTGFQVSVDGAAFATLGSGIATGVRLLGSIANGLHTIRVRAVGTTPDGVTVYSLPSDTKSVVVA